jgi:hypothetical protein
MLFTNLRPGACAQLPDGRVAVRTIYGCVLVDPEKPLSTYIFQESDPHFHLEVGGEVWHLIGEPVRVRDSGDAA